MLILSAHVVISYHWLSRYCASQYFGQVYTSALTWLRKLLKQKGRNQN